MIYKPRYPVYVVSKSRADSRLTVRCLIKMGVPFRVIIEASQWDMYAAVIDPTCLLILPQKYLDEYDTFDDLGFTKSKGPGAARNFAWDHAIEGGFKRHWVLDDNLDAFHRLMQGTKNEADTGAMFAAMEDFVDRYSNVALAGPQYYSFIDSTAAIQPYTLNTRIYSCLLIDNAIPYRWRGRYNEDTDLALRVLKDGLCTIQFNAFLQGKVCTQMLKGGNTEAFYAEEGTMPKSQMLADMHPDVARVVWRFNRWHHVVDYKPFAKNALIKVPGVVIPKGINNYGMIHSYKFRGTEGRNVD